jgi:methylenetetrahydrofolate reductase (NADPH)
MLDECEDAALRCGVTTRSQPLPVWKRRASRVFVHISWSIDDLLAWRSRTSRVGSVFAGVMVLPSAGFACRIGARVPELLAPTHVLDAVERDPSAGGRIASELIDAIRNSGAFDGVHLVGDTRLRTVKNVDRPTPARVPAGMTHKRFE